MQIFIIRGKKIDTIKQIIDGPNLPLIHTMEKLSGDDGATKDVSSREYEWIERIIRAYPHASYVSGSSINEVIGRTLALDGSLHSPKTTLDYGAALEGLLRLLKNPLEATYDQVMNSNSFFIEKGLCRAQVCYEIALTANDYLAWVPKKSVVGDSIVSFDGGHIPHILRAAPSRLPEASKPTASQVEDPAQQNWILVGSSYVYGWIEHRLPQLKDTPSEDIRII